MKHTTTSQIFELNRLLEEADRDDELPDNTEAAIYKLVETFSGITKRKLWIVNGRAAMTDGHKITVPLDAPEAYLLTEHELAHILFKSDTHAKDRFVSAYSAKVTEVAKERGVRIDPERLAEAVDMLISVLEDHRVNTLWGVLYPGSFVRIHDLRQVLYLKYLDHASLNLGVYFGCLESGLAISTPRFDKFQPYMLEAIQKVELRGFAATLSMAKWLLMKIIDAIIEDKQVPEAMDSAKKDPEIRSQTLGKALMTSA